MNALEVIAALDLPLGARVDRRVPKKLLAEHGAPTAADKRRILDGIEEVQWLAALKPTTIGVPAYSDKVREYIEIAVLCAVLRADAKADRLAALIHRAVPYPVFLIATEGERLTVSLAHKRWSQGEAAATVLEGELVTAVLEAGKPDQFAPPFREALALAHQPRADLYLLYQGWMNALFALLAARVTGAFTTAASLDQAAARREALGDYARLDTEIARLRAVAATEKQISKRVELNLKLKRAENDRAVAFARL